MAENFETQLGRMFADAPPMADEEAFARRVERRLGRGFATRRLLIGAGGLLGGVIAVAQMLNANLTATFQEASTAAAAAPLSSARVTEVMTQTSSLLPVGGGMTEVMWMAAGLGAAALALLATRVMGEM